LRGERQEPGQGRRPKRDLTVAKVCGDVGGAPGKGRAAASTCTSASGCAGRTAGWMRAQLRAVLEMLDVWFTACE